MVELENRLLAKYNHSRDRFAECFADCVAAKRRIEELEGLIANLNSVCDCQGCGGIDEAKYTAFYAPSDASD